MADEKFEQFVKEIEEAPDMMSIAGIVLAKAASDIGSLIHNLEEVLPNCAPYVFSLAMGRYAIIAEKDVEEFHSEVEEVYQKTIAKVYQQLEEEKENG